MDTSANVHHQQHLPFGFWPSIITIYNTSVGSNYAYSFIIWKVSSFTVVFKRAKNILATSKTRQSGIENELNLDAIENSAFLTGCMGNPI